MGTRRSLVHDVGYISLRSDLCRVPPLASLSKLPCPYVMIRVSMIGSIAGTMSGSHA